MPAISEAMIAAIAENFDETAKICARHHDTTGSAAFLACANRIRRAAGLPESSAWVVHEHAQHQRGSHE